MFTQTQYMTQLQQERRRLTIHNHQLLRSQKLQKQKTDQFVEIVKKKDKKIAELEREKGKLSDELEKARLTIESYKQMLFQMHKHADIAEENQDTKQQEEQATTENALSTKKKNGQKKGHKGFGRKKPEIIDQQVVCSLAVCPDCGNPVEPSDKFHSHTVTDIPHWKEMKPVTTEYKIAYQ